MYMKRGVSITLNAFMLNYGKRCSRNMQHVARTKKNKGLSTLVIILISSKDDKLNLFNLIYSTTIKKKKKNKKGKDVQKIVVAMVSSVKSSRRSKHVFFRGGGGSWVMLSVLGVRDDSRE